MPVSASQLHALFAPRPVPEPLLELLAFQEEVGYGNHSQSLTLSLDDKSGLMHGWSRAPAFLDALFPFAMANASGSFYALWRAEDSEDSSAWPVVVFGDEGGEWVVADNLADLLRISTFDVEPMVDYRDVVFFKNEDDEWYQPSAQISRYIEWISVNFGVEPAEDPNAIVARSSAVWQEKFDAWKSPFLAHKDAA